MDPAEYSRRKAFLAKIASMSRSEHIGIIQTLRKHGVFIQENNNGCFFDLTQISAEVFEELLALHVFVEKNNNDLKLREEEMNELASEIKTIAAKPKHVART
jgi:hypothetical protein